MNAMSLHRRSSSLSSLDSYGSDGLFDAAQGEDLVVDQLSDRIYNAIFPPPPPPSEGQETPRPLRRRLGAEEAIMAVSSPEIKALDLPLTPAGFPRRQKRINKTLAHHRMQSAPSVIEIYNDFPASPSPKALPKCKNRDKENIDPQKPFVTPVKTKAFGRKVLRNRSNNIAVQPNDSDYTYVVQKDIFKKSRNHQKPIDSLPSPLADAKNEDKVSNIRECIDPRSPQEKEQRPLTSSLRNLKDGGACRREVSFRERSMNLTTGFR